MAKGLKRKAWDWMSKYVRLRDSIAYCRKNNLPLDSGWVACCCCGEVGQWKYADAGHYFGRGSGGSSGVYLDQRNVHAQKKQCNAFRGGGNEGYRRFMLKEYGQDVLDDLEFRHRNKVYQQKDFIGFELYYKQEFERLKGEAKNGCN